MGQSPPNQRLRSLVSLRNPCGPGAKFSPRERERKETQAKSRPPASKDAACPSPPCFLPRAGKLAQEATQLRCAQGGHHRRRQNDRTGRSHGPADPERPGYPGPPARLPLRRYDAGRSKLPSCRAAVFKVFGESSSTCSGWQSWLGVTQETQTD